MLLGAAVLATTALALYRYTVRDAAIRETMRESDASAGSRDFQRADDELPALTLAGRPPGEPAGVFDARPEGTLAGTTYPYSVVPGGVESVERLRRIADSDAVVGAHYREFNLAVARITTLAAVRRAYVSYRIGDRVYWTRKRLTIPRGERVITDGVKLARVRCGNQLSFLPMDPTRADEPPAAVLDAPILPSFPLGFGVPPIAAGEQPQGGLAALGGLGGFGVPLGGGGPVSSLSNGPGVLPPIDVPIDAGDPGPSTAGVSTTGGTGTPGENIPPTIPGGPGGPGGPSGPGGPNGPEQPNQPLPVPEPATVILLGTGVAGLIARHRLKNRQDDPPC